VIRIPKLEMHLAYGCNLRCRQCSHYANYALGGIVPLDIGTRWIVSWSERLEPVQFSFLGGEPLLNPAVAEFLLLGRMRWPHTTLRLVTNGLMLPKYGERLWCALAETETLLTISVHSRDADYTAQLENVARCVQEQAVQHGFRYELRNSIDGWHHMYQGDGPAMLPFNDGDPAASWRVCQSKHCLTLEDNALWKCPRVAHLPRVARKFPLSTAWQTALRYAPLTLDASDDDIRSFIARREEPACALCPSTLVYFEKQIG